MKATPYFADIARGTLPLYLVPPPMFGQQHRRRPRSASMSRRWERARDVAEACGSAPRTAAQASLRGPGSSARRLRPGLGSCLPVLLLNLPGRPRQG
jgi:hypothetical protein